MMKVLKLLLNKSLLSYSIYIFIVNFFCVRLNCCKIWCQNIRKFAIFFITFIPFIWFFFCNVTFSYYQSSIIYESLDGFVRFCFPIRDIILLIIIIISGHTKSWYIKRITCFKSSPYFYFIFFSSSSFSSSCRRSEMLLYSQ